MSWGFPALSLVRVHAEQSGYHTVSNMQVPAVADLPASLKRQAAHRADSHSNYLLTLESSHLAMDSDLRGAAVQ